MCNACDIEHYARFAGNDLPPPRSLTPLVVIFAFLIAFGIGLYMMRR